MNTYASSIKSCLQTHKSLREVNRGWEDDNNNPLEEEVISHFKNLRQMVSSPSVASGLNRVPSVRKTVRNLQQETEFYYLSVSWRFWVYEFVSLD